MKKGETEIQSTLVKITGEQYQIFSAAEAKLEREKRRKLIQKNFFSICVEAKMCPVCGSELVTVEDYLEYHERMMEDEYGYTKITCRSCGRLTKVFVDSRM